MRSRVEPSTNSPGCRMNASISATSTSSVMSSSGRARSMYAWRLERKTRKKRSRRMSTLAGWTQDGSKGSMPIRPDAIAARMSRSESTTVAKYGLGRARQREDRFAQIGPRGDHIVCTVDAVPRETPQDLDGARARGLPHCDVRVRVPDHDALLRRATQALHRVLGEIRRRLRSRDRIAAEVNGDLTRDAEATQDPLAVRGALARDGGLEQAELVERVQRLARPVEQLRRRDDLAVVDVSILGAIADGVIRREIPPRFSEDLLD